MADAAREHIEEIRRKKFSIGGEQNPLTEDLHQAVKNLSAELYAKDVHFLMELIQNAEDNDYLEGKDPSLEFVITFEDITNTMATTTLLIFNNEKGFSSKNIDSICSIGRSTKKGNRKRGYIGEKGEILNARASRMICWDRESSKFFTQKLDRSSGYENQIEYATYFSEAISEGVLWENCDHIGALSELIKLAFVLEFDEKAVRFLMKSKNLQIYLEDEEFLASVFPSD